ncbi:hypothetical protein [Nonomuraea sp. NPDC001699]
MAIRVGTSSRRWLIVSAVLLPWRDSLPNTSVALVLVVGVAVSQLAAYARRMRVVTIISAGYLKHIYETAELAQASAGAHAMVEHVRDQIVEILGLKGCRFEYGGLTRLPGEAGSVQPSSQCAASPRSENIGIASL